MERKDMVKRVFDGVFAVLLVLSALALLSPVGMVAFLSLGERLGGYVDFFVWEPDYVNALLNSLTISLTVAVGSVAVSTFAAYVFAKVPFPGRGLVFYLYIIVMMMPFQVTLLPQYIVARDLGTYNTLLAMILPGIFAPFSAFLLTQMMKSLPDELIEAARLDTRSTFVIICQIVMPAIRPGMICAGVLVFTEQWNAVAEPLILMESRKVYPLAVMLNNLRPGDVLGFAATALFILPALLLFIFFEGEIMEGLGEYLLK